jgi:3',5'-cyclic AMP phosphodiesterase CpdA
LDDVTAAVHAAQPDQILLTGDLAHIGLPEEIEEAASWLETLGPPESVFLVPGNHDDYAADSRAALISHWGRYLGDLEDYPRRRVLDGVEIIGVNTALPTRPVSACGLVGEAQLARLARTLRAPRSGPRLLAIHHPPLPGMINFRKRLRDADELRTLLDRQLVDVVVHGHGHRNRTVMAHGIHVCAVNSASYEDGSYRQFDIERDGDGWEVRMQLFSRSGNGRSENGFRIREQDVWRLAG